MTPEEQTEILQVLDGTVRELMTQHQARRKDWYFHDFVPWERGRNFIAEPWEESQATIAPEARTALILNLLTEDNLPYYHEAIGRNLPADSALSEWNRLWTAEEAQHAVAIRSYLLTSRNCDPYELEDDRKSTMFTGYQPSWENPAELFAYTSAQELATRVSHRNTGKITDDPAAYDLMKMIAADENHHFLFYRGVMMALLRESPSAAIEAIFKVFTNFEMPGAAMPRFLRRSVEVAKAGVYNLRVHHDNVLLPLIRDWNVGGVLDLSARAAEMQQKLMEFPAQVMRRAEIFEKRLGIAPA